MKTNTTNAAKTNENPAATAADIVRGDYYCDQHGVMRRDDSPADYGSPACPARPRPPGAQRIP